MTIEEKTPEGSKRQNITGDCTRLIEIGIVYSIRQHLIGRTRMGIPVQQNILNYQKKNVKTTLKFGPFEIPSTRWSFRELRSSGSDVTHQDCRPRKC